MANLNNLELNRTYPAKLVKAFEVPDKGLIRVLFEIEGDTYHKNYWYRIKNGFGISDKPREKALNRFHQDMGVPFKNWEKGLTRSYRITKKYNPYSTIEYLEVT